LILLNNNKNNMKKLLLLFAVFITVTATAQTINVGTATELQNALNGNYSCINLVGTSYTGEFTIPTTLLAKSKTVIINGNGAAIYGGFYRTAPDQATALNTMNQYSATFRDLRLFKGTSRNGCGIYWASTYGLNVDNVRVEGKDSAVVCRFALKSIINNCISVNCKRIGFLYDKGDWVGASNSNSQSNCSIFNSCRVFNADSAEYAFGIIAASECSMNTCISEGGSPKIHVLFDGTNSTVVKEFYARTVHVESVASVAAFKVSIREGIIFLQNIYAQYGQVLVDATSQAGYPNIMLDNTTWKPSGTTLKSTGGCRWYINGGTAGMDWTATTTWVGGKLPTVLVQDRMTASGIERKTFVNGTLK